MARSRSVSAESSRLIYQYVAPRLTSAAASSCGSLVSASISALQAEMRRCGGKASSSVEAQISEWVASAAWAAGAIATRTQAAAKTNRAGRTEGLHQRLERPHRPSALVARRQRKVLHRRAQGHALRARHLASRARRSFGCSCG